VTTQRRIGSQLTSGAAAVAGALAVALAVGELGTRLLDRDGHVYDVEMFRYARELKRDAPADAPAMHHWHVPGAHAVLQGVPVRINSRGLRDREFAYAVPPGVTRILVLGDSITFGWGVPIEDSYPKVLERLLNADEPGRYQVLNGGVGNYTTSRIIALYRYELHKYGAQVVVFSFYLNNANETPDSRLQFLFDTPLEFPVFLWSRLQRVASRYGVGPDFDEYYRQLYREGTPSYERFKGELLGFLEELEAQGRKVVVVSIPDVRHLTEPRYRYAGITERVRAVAAQAGAPFLDLYPSVRGLPAAKIVNSPEDRHPNAEGHRRFARALAGFLKGLGV
jgi:lysophospholipase L1-like esterase